MRMPKFIVAALTVLALVGFARAEDAKKPADDAAKKPAINKYCAVEGGDHTVDPDVYTIYKGQKIGFCCKDCVKDFESDPETYMKKLHDRKDDAGGATAAKDTAKKDETKKEEKK